MMDSMKLWLIQQLISTIVLKLDEGTLRQAANGLIEAAEAAARRSENKLDDSVLPLLAQLDKAFGDPSD